MQQYSTNMPKQKERRQGGKASGGKYLPIMYSVTDTLPTSIVRRKNYSTSCSHFGRAIWHRRIAGSMIERRSRNLWGSGLLPGFTPGCLYCSNLAGRQGKRSRCRRNSAGAAAEIPSGVYVFRTSNPKVKKATGVVELGPRSA